MDTFFLRERGDLSCLMVETLLSYRLSWFMIPSRPEDGLIIFVFFHGHPPPKGVWPTLASIYLGLLNARLDECVNNIVRLLERYDAVTQADTSFIQMLVLEHFGALPPKPIEFCAMEMMDMVPDEVSRQKPSNLYKPRAWHSSNVKQANNNSLSKVINEEKNFDFRQYTYTPRDILKVQQVLIKKSASCPNGLFRRRF